MNQVVVTTREETLAKIKAIDSCKKFQESGFVFGMSSEVDKAFMLVISHENNDRPVVIKLPIGSTVTIANEWDGDWETKLITVS